MTIVRTCIACNCIVCIDEFQIWKNKTRHLKHNTYYLVFTSVKGVIYGNSNFKSRSNTYKLEGDKCLCSRAGAEVATSIH